MAGYLNVLRPLLQPPQEHEAGALDLFDLLGLGLAAVVLDATVAVEIHSKGIWVSARSTPLPIPEAKDHRPAASASSSESHYASKGISESENSSHAILLSSRATVTDAVARLGDIHKASCFDGNSSDLRR